MARKTKQESLETRERILDAAEHIFYRDGVALSGLEDIAKEAGMTRGAIYWHFKNKGELFQAMHARIHLPLEDLLNKIASTPSPEALHALQKVCVNAVLDLQKDEQKRRIFTVLLLRCEYAGDMAEIMVRLKEMQNAMTATMQGFFEQCQKKNIVSCDLSPALIAQTLCALMNGLIKNYLMNPLQFKSGDIEQIITHFFRTTIGNK